MAPPNTSATQTTLDPSITRVPPALFSAPVAPTSQNRPADLTNGLPLVPRSTWRPSPECRRTDAARKEAQPRVLVHCRRVSKKGGAAVGPTKYVYFIRSRGPQGLPRTRGALQYHKQPRPSPHGQARREAELEFWLGERGRCRGWRGQQLKGSEELSASASGRWSRGDLQNSSSPA